MTDSKLHRARWPLLLIAAITLTGCGSMRSYDKEAGSTLQSASSGNIDNALAQHEANNKGDVKDKDLLYFLEKGQLLQMKGDLPASTETWLAADEKVRNWEEDAKTDANKLMGDIGSFLVNDKTRRYDGFDHEKVFLSTSLAINHAAAGNWDLARVEVKKTHEREAIIAEYRAKVYEKVEAEAKEKGSTSTFKELKGYPVETLDDPEVLGLKNSYQNAVGHYVAGFVYEALNEPSLAAPAYRTAIELQPKVKILEDGLSGIDSRRSRAKRNEADVLFVIGSGNAASRNSISLPFPFWWKGKLNYTQVSFPVIKSDGRLDLPANLTIDGRPISVARIADVDAMARRALRDDMPGIILRTTVRAITKGVAQNELANRAGLAGALIGAVAVAVTEQADERVWRSLPSQVAIARASLPHGKHTLSIPSAFANKTFDLEVGGRYMLVPLRVVNGGVYFTQPALKPTIAVAEEVQSTAPAPELVAPTKPSKSNSKPPAKKKKAASPAPATPAKP